MRKDYKEKLVNKYNAEFRANGRLKVKKKLCACKCPTCGKRWVQLSFELYTDRLNYIYCEDDRGNRNRAEDGHDRLIDEARRDSNRRYKERKRKEKENLLNKSCGVRS